MSRRASSNPQANKNPQGGPSTTRQDELVVGRAGDKPLLIAVHGESSIAYVVALVAGGGPSGMHSQCELLNRYFMSLTFHSPLTYPTRNSPGRPGPKAVNGVSALLSCPEPRYHFK